MKHNEQPNMVKVLAHRKMPKNYRQPQPDYPPQFTNHQRMLGRAELRELGYKGIQ